ncbi:hypothetical protein JG688_00018500 [Phytophthora aleatoria]|uniref:Uncharacterized protein n=1 Tax=Phytophthora aleatoria TaxID=2496075 RepID=A0A8J5MBG1_9STRA|nr:hypothetical protein JG688_00018500 [Phytophthora aleatoria]
MLFLINKNAIFGGPDGRRRSLCDISKCCRCLRQRSCTGLRTPTLSGLHCLQRLSMCSRGANTSMTSTDKCFARGGQLCGLHSTSIWLTGWRGRRYQ